MNNPNPADPKTGTPAAAGEPAPAVKPVAAHGPAPIPAHGAPFPANRGGGGSRFMPQRNVRPKFVPGAMRQQMHGRQGG